jgi:hypothetical protein
VVFFAVWGVVLYLFVQMAPDSTMAGIVVGFIAGIVAAAKRTSGRL